MFSAVDAAISPIIGSIKNNFVVALFWTALGKTFATGSIKVQKKSALIFTLISFAFLWAERYLNITLLHTKGNADCFFMLIPACLFLFALLLQIDSLKIRSAKLLRNLSTLIYVIHYAVIICLPRFASLPESLLPLYLFSGALFASIVAGLCIIKLSEIKQLKFLKYLY